VGRFLLKHAWFGILLGLFLLLLPNAWLRSLLPVSGEPPTPTSLPTVDLGQGAYEQGLALAASEPLGAVPFLEQIVFTDHPSAENARTLLTAIQAGRVSEDPAYLLTVSGQSLAAIGEWRLARQALLEAVQLNAEFAEAWAYLGEAQFHNGEDSWPALERAMELNPDSMAVQLFNALYWQRQGAFEEASLHFYIASQLDPENISIYLQWGQNAILAGNAVEARQHFEKAMALAPDDPNVRKSMVRYSIESDLFVSELGLPAATQLVQRDPTDLESLVLLGRAHIQLGNKQTGVGFLERVIEISPQHAPAHFYLGLFYLAEEETGQAMVELNQVIALAPGSEEAIMAAELIVQYSR
jgi:tetratricopeptide (TPR) repeat protein